MAVGSAVVAEVSRARPEAGTLRSRKASAAPDPKSKKLGGGARASPPHKNLSGFDIQMHYTRSEPAVDQLGEEFHGRLRGGVGAGDGEHSPHVVCQGAEPCRRLASDPYRRRGNTSLANSSTPRSLYLVSMTFSCESYSSTSSHSSCPLSAISACETWRRRSEVPWLSIANS